MTNTKVVFLASAVEGRAIIPNMRTPARSERSGHRREPVAPVPAQDGALIASQPVRKAPQRAIWSSPQTGGQSRRQARPGRGCAFYAGALLGRRAAQGSVAFTRGGAGNIRQPPRGRAHVRRARRRRAIVIWRDLSAVTGRDAIALVASMIGGLGRSLPKLWPASSTAERGPSAGSRRSSRRCWRAGF